MNAVIADQLAAENLTYPRERVLGAVTLILGLVVWVALLVGTVGVALVFLGFGGIVYLFTHSAFTAHVKGNGVELSQEQFPDIHSQLLQCCRRMGMDEIPKAYILNGNGMLNAFATRFLRDRYVVLTSDIVDAMHDNPEGLRFYLGHELGHLRMKHLSWQWLRWPVLWLPLLGAAYSRARESTCDRHGLACSGSPRSAVLALSVLAAGRSRWKDLNVAHYVQQTEQSFGFWMSFHELISGYPWLTTRAARMMSDETVGRKRSPWAYILAAVVPFGGRLGAGLSFLMMVYILFLLAAIAIPAYQDYTIRGQLTRVRTESALAREKLAAYYSLHHETPDSLAAADLPDQLPDGSLLSLDPKAMTLSVRTSHGEIMFVPAEVHGGILWTCTNGTGLKPNQLPRACRTPSR